MKIAILGAGRIAVHMAETLAGMDDVEAYAVGARELERSATGPMRRRLLLRRNMDLQRLMVLMKKCWRIKKLI